MNKTIPVFILLFCFFAINLYGQPQPRRASPYEALLMRTDRPSAYIDHVTFPDADGATKLAVLFRFDYDFVPFMKKQLNMKSPSPESEFFAPVQLGFEVFEGRAPRSRRSADDAVSIFRENWQDTIWVETYEKTTSRSDYTQGLLSTSLEPGSYHYELQLIRSNVAGLNPPDDRSRRRGYRSPAGEWPSRMRTVDLTEESINRAEFILLNNFQQNSNTFSGTFLNYGDNVLYGEDYSLLVRIPENAGENSESLSLNLYRILGGGNSNTEELQHTQEITDNETVYLADFRLTDENKVGFTANIDGEGTKYAFVRIPNRNFENSGYRLRLENTDIDQVLGEKMIQSVWRDMPVSLYSLDVAIEMLRFIMSDKELDRIDSGSNSEREQKFREFWSQRDPTPETEYNELMTEYYNRIDYAYNEFSSMQTPGFETDQGKAYVLYGPPNDVERRLPTNAPTREVWHYPNRTLIFEATTGFGDFKLISEQQS